MKKLLTKLVTCWMFGDHDWTCAAKEGVPPTREQLKDINGFLDYARMYCRRCGKESDISRHNRDANTTLPTITCPKCGRRSYSAGDGENRYCGACHMFHDMII